MRVFQSRSRISIRLAQNLQDCEDEKRIRIVPLSDKLENICFMQGISSDRIRTIVSSRRGITFYKRAETTLGEENAALFSKNERYRQGPTQGA